MLFTAKTTFISAEDLMNLSMWIDLEGALPQPAIMKPKPLWTGKQVFSLLLPRIQYCKYIDRKGWASLNDKNIMIKDGELLTGQLTKGQCGNTGGGLVHIIWKEHGADVCKTFLSQTQGVINHWLVLHGFTVGVSDIITRPETNQRIRQTLKK